MKYIIIQSIGVIAYIILMWSYHQEKKIQILFMQIFSSLAFAIHYYLLNGITGAICNVVSIFMMTVIYFYEKKKEKKNKGILIGIMVPVLVIIASFTWENIFSIFPIVASSINLIGFLLDKENIIRFIGIIVALSWLIYGVIYLSYSAILFETLTIITTIIAIMRNRNIEER